MRLKRLKYHFKIWYSPPPELISEWTELIAPVRISCGDCLGMSALKFWEAEGKELRWRFPPPLLIGVDPPKPMDGLLVCSLLCPIRLLWMVPVFGWTLPEFMIMLWVLGITVWLVGTARWLLETLSVPESGTLEFHWLVSLRKNGSGNLKTIFKIKYFPVLITTVIVLIIIKYVVRDIN